jgi:uncharacterized protein (TIGR03545 family)
MIRWRFVVTRLLIVLVVLLLVRLGLGPVAGYVTVEGLQKTTGAKVEIDQTYVGLFPPRVRYEHFRVADPRDGKQMRDAFRADTVELELDGNAMLRRRWVAREGKITGLQIGAERIESGHFQDEDLMTTSQSDAPGVLSRLLDGLADQMESHAKHAAKQLETVRRSEEIKERWKREYAMLAKRVEMLEQKIKEFKAGAREIENPLRDWGNLESTIRVANESRVELKAILTALDSIPERFDADLASLEKAKQADLDRIDQLVPGDLAESNNFGIDLIQQAVREQIAGLRTYWESGRTLANYTVVAPENERSRGVTIDLLGKRRRPTVLVQRCLVEGMLRADGNAYSLTGVVHNMTPSPQRLVEPFRAELQLEGPQVVTVDYVRDRRNGNDVDRLTLHWPQANAPAMSLGNDKHARISVTGGKREVWVQMRSEGNKIQGRFVSTQTGVQLGLDVDSKFDDLPATGALRQSLADVDLVTVDAEFNGSWKRLDDLSINSNLGKVLRQASRQAIDLQFADSKRKLSQRLAEVTSKQQHDLRQWFAKQQLDAQSLTAQADALLEGIGNKMLQGVDSSEVTVGRMGEFLRGRF